MADVPEVTDDSFESKVLQAEKPTLVDFWAEWCGPCKMIGPIVEEVAEEYDGQLRVVKMDVDANPSIPQRLGIMGIPTLILFNRGKEVERLVGFRDKEGLVKVLLPYLT